MKGLILKDYYCLKKSIPMLFMVSFGTIFLSVLFLLSCKYGNIADYIVRTPEEIINGEQMLEEDFYGMLRMAIWLVLLIPMAYTANVFDCFKADKEADFSKFLFSLPVREWQMAGARYLACFLYIGVGISAAVITAICTAMTSDYMVLSELLSVVVIFAGVMLSAMAVMMPLAYLVGRKTAGYIALGIGVALYLLCAVCLLMSGDASVEYLLANLQDIKNKVINFVTTKGVVVFGIALATFGVSYLCSVLIIKKRRGRAI